MSKKKVQPKKKKSSFKEYLPIIAIIVGVALFVGAVVLFTAEKEITYAEAIVYYAYSNNQFAAEKVLVDSENMEKGVVEALMNEPLTPGLKKTVNGKVKVLSVDTVNGLCTVNLSEEFLLENGNDVNKEANAVYAIANSLGMLQSVREVKINIEGDSECDLGHIKLSNTFFPEWNMVRFEDRP